MAFVKIIFGLIVLIFGIIIVFGGWVYADFNYIGPWKHERNTERAEVFNQENWETGIASIYTIAATAELAEFSKTETMEIICARKMETQTIGLKGGPSLWDGEYNFSPRTLAVPIDKSFRAVFDTTASCSGLKSSYEEHNVPFNATATQTATIQHVVEPYLSCTSFPNDGPMQLISTRIHPTEIIAVRYEPLREVLTREEYGPADHAVMVEIGYEKPEYNEYSNPQDRRFYWFEEKSCWREFRGDCSTFATNMCEPRQ